MKTSDRSRFEIGALRALAGDKVFARGAEYHRDGLVQILALEPGRVLAEVAGNEDYRTVVTGHGTQIGGECSCPAFEDWGFCKHIVAAAIAANAADADADGEGAGALSRIRDHLRRKSVNELVAMIVDLAEQDLILFRKLDMAAAALHEDDKKLEARLRKAIDGATRTRDFVDYRAAASWAAGVDAALDALAELASGERAGVILKLAARAIERIERAVEDIDDSDGHCTTLLDRARSIHLAAARAARPEAKQLARDLFAREMASEYDTFHGAAALYADVLGEEGLAEYRRLAAAAWDQLPPLRGRQERQEASADYDRLADILDFFAEQDGNLDARLALRTKDLSSAWRYLRLAEFCRAHGREDEALRRAEEGLWLFEDGRPDERLIAFAAELLIKAGRSKDAEAQLWRAFEKAPGLELYKRIRQLAGEGGRDRALKFLEARLGREESTRWHYPADLLASILMHEKMFDEAWAVVRSHGVSNGLKEQLAQESEAMHPREAIATYAERVDQLANTGGNPAYAEAAVLVARMAALRDAPGQATYVAALKVRFSRKRNFMKLLL
jgi:SWIM zinc finger